MLPLYTVALIKYRNIIKVMSSLDIPKLTDEELDDTPQYGKVQKMTTKFENLISSISIEELNKVGDEEIVNLVSELKNKIP